MRVMACTCEWFHCALQVEQMTIQVEELTMSANQASELLENEQLEKRHLQEQLAEISVGREGRGGGGEGS